MSIYSKKVDAGLGGSSKKVVKVEDALGREVARLALEQSPVGVERDTVVAQSLDLLENIEPQTGDRKTVRVEFTAVKVNSFASDEERGVVECLISESMSVMNLMRNVRMPLLTTISCNSALFVLSMMKFSGLPAILRADARPDRTAQASPNTFEPSMITYDRLISYLSRKGVQVVIQKGLL